jgi:lysyl-tRNA synthetase class 2
MNNRFIRVTNAQQNADGTCRVAFFDGDVEKEEIWQAPLPLAGDIFEKTSRGFEKTSGAFENGWKTDGDGLRWRKPLKPNGLSRLEILRRRAVVRRAVRAYLDRENYIEIDAPLLVRGTTPDMAVESFPVEDLYLSTSTEYQLKRLEMGGVERLYSLTQNFRHGDVGRFRNPEFTMLEWGAAGARIEDIEQDVENFVSESMSALGLPQKISYQGQTIDMKAPWPRLSVAKAVLNLTGVDISDFESESCWRAAEAAGVGLHDEWRGQRDFLFSVLMDELQPRLGTDRPVLLCDWPLYQTTSAASDDGKTVKRSELYIAGIEIADGFAGLADPTLQEQFFGYASEQRKALGMPDVAWDAKYLEAMRGGAPYGAGMALGFDRLVMLLTDQPEIKNVLSFAWEEL